MDAIKKKNRFVFLFVLVVTSSFVFGEEDDGKEDEIECVNSCGDTVDEWKKCAKQCYGDYLDESDQTFLACESDCVDRFYKPDVEESELGDLEICAARCVEEYRGELRAKH
ncbi:unnamed protein product [Caenorhabditis sp. 36 PRJEB53466]|nr:unnamed protein product [Caenorhabditis sp. 36 PRJEB53466]